MAMTPQEMIEFYSERTKSIQKGLEVGKSSNNYYLIAQNFDKDLSVN